MALGINGRIWLDEPFLIKMAYSKRWNGRQHRRLHKAAPWLYWCFTIGYCAKTVSYIQRMTTFWQCCYYFFPRFLISLSETWGQTDNVSGKLLLFVITHGWFIRLLFYRGVRESVCSDVIWRHTGVHNVWLARVIRTKLESQLGQVVVLSKPYYIYFLSYTDVPDFEAYHKYSQVYLIISRQW